MKECYSWLAINGSAIPTEQQMIERGWNSAFSLRTWTDYPGQTITMSGVMTQKLTFGLFGSHGGENTWLDAEFYKEAKASREFWKSVA